MMEDCATRMSVPHGCNNDMAVVDSFKEALKQRIGAERYQMWFAQGVDFAIEMDSVEEDASSEASGSDKASGSKASGSNGQAKLRNGSLFIRVHGQFALERIRNNFMPELRGAAMQACDTNLDVQLVVDEPPATQGTLPLSDEEDEGAVAQKPAKPRSQRRPKFNVSQTPDGPQRGRRRKTQSLKSLVVQGAGTIRSTAGKTGDSLGKSTYASTGQQEFSFPGLKDDSKSPGPEEKKSSKRVAKSKPASGRESSSATQSGKGQSGKGQSGKGQSGKGQRGDQRIAMTADTFVSGSCNQLAYTAMSMVCNQPGSASPLFVSGPTGTGKSHILHAIADQFRRRYRMRRVMYLSAEQFTNDFISSVGNSGITSFRRRYRDVDALLIDDIQFLGAKQATLREMLYTVETLAAAGRPLVFSGLQSPTDIPGLSRELAGRLASGLVCPIQPLDAKTRDVILRRMVDQRCRCELPADLVERIVPLLAGDGRVISGVVNLINTLERMNNRVPTMDELRHFGGELLRAAGPIASLSVIEMAVCETFGLSQDSLRVKSQTRAVTQPRMLAMYLSRQLTSSAYTEIARHFGGRSHSTAIQAEKNVKDWLTNEKTIGRGHSSMSTQEAIHRIENLLRTG